MLLLSFRIRLGILGTVGCWNWNQEGSSGADCEASFAAMKQTPDEASISPLSIYAVDFRILGYINIKVHVSRPRGERELLLPGHFL